MREIKFRGQMTTGEWVYGLPHLDLPGSTAYYNECSYRICWSPETGGSANAPIKNGTLGQFTGLKDKAFGKEVYDGDLCTATFKSKGGEVINLTGDIIWDDFMWCFETFNDLFSLNRVTIIEVIGNIYENPELLK